MTRRTRRCTHINLDLTFRILRSAKAVEMLLPLFLGWPAERSKHLFSSFQTPSLPFQPNPHSLARLLHILLYQNPTSLHLSNLRPKARLCLLQGRSFTVLPQGTSRRFCGCNSMTEDFLGQTLEDRLLARLLALLRRFKHTQHRTARVRRRHHQPTAVLLRILLLWKPCRQLYQVEAIEIDAHSSSDSNHELPELAQTEKIEGMLLQKHTPVR